MIKPIFYLILVLPLFFSCRTSREGIDVQQSEFRDSSVISISAMERIQELLREDRNESESLEVDFSIVIPADSLKPFPIIAKGKTRRKRSVQHTVQADRIRDDTLQATETIQRHESSARECHSKAVEDFKSSGSSFWWKVAFFFILTLMVYDTLWRR